VASILEDALVLLLKMLNQELLFSIPAGDAGKGIRAFRDGLKDGGKPEAPGETAAAKVDAPKEDARG
jgi:hypothetical protein